MAASWETGGRATGAVVAAAAVFGETSRMGACSRVWEGR